ncbi:hypothetical protein K438DRAFT_1496379, partial [Mycena galopus ATCC 62051]
MDATKFAVRLDPVTSGLIDVISNDVLQGENVDKSLRAELSRLKVYGSLPSGHGAFDEPGNTLSDDSFIGSLVITFPTAHAGGRLTIQDGNATFFYDPSAALSAAATPSVSYIALYGGVSTAMAPVDAGHRVSLIYDLFLVDHNSNATPRVSIAVSATERLLEDKIRALLADPGFLPIGGFLAVGLAHKYPIPL